MICIKTMVAVGGLLAASVAEASPQVLDDYSSDANFVSGQYTHMPVYIKPGFSGPLTGTTFVTDGTLRVQTANPNTVIAGTSAHLWNAGQALRRAGDTVSLDLISNNISWATSVGMYLSNDLTDPTASAELRIYTNNTLEYIRWVGPWGSDTAADRDMIPGGTPFQANLEVLVLDTDATNIFMRSTLTSESFPTLVRDFDIEASEVYFGPSAYWNRFTFVDPEFVQNSEHDNLVFTPFVPSTGDLNGNGLLTNGDISAFVQALTDPTRYANDFAGLDPDVIGDFNGDGFLTNGDIAGFVAALASDTSSAVPEPASLALLLGVGLLPATRRRRR